MTQLQTQAVEISQEAVQRMQEDGSRRIAEELRRNSRVTMFRKKQFNPYRKLNADQHETIAKAFESKRTSVSARKARINVRLEPIKRLNQLVDRAYYAWRAMTVPYPEQGKRVIRAEKIAQLEAMITEITLEIREAEQELEQQRGEVIRDAQERLGKLFNDGDYPETFAGHWSISIEYPNVEPDPKLCQLHPEIYEREVQRIKRRFDECVRRTEQELAQEFAGTIAKLAERMEPNPDGTRKIFHKSTIENLNQFFERFRELNLHSNEELDALVDQAQGVVQGITPDALKRDDQAREQLHAAMSKVSEKLDSLLITAPNREISFDDDE